MKTFQFALGDGRHARGLVVDDRGKLVEVAHPESGTRMICSRRAFLDGVWRIDGAVEANAPPERSADGVFTPAGFEREVLARSGGMRFERAISVVDGLSATVYSDGISRIRIRGTAPAIPETARVLDVGDATSLPQLDHLAHVRALRVVRVRAALDLDAIAPLRPSMLALEHVAVAQLAALARWTWLEQLELRGFWQYNVGDVEWLMALPNLRRLTLDLGGRRKNVEVYKRLRTAYAWPFDLMLLSARA